MRDTGALGICSHPMKRMARCPRHGDSAILQYVLSSQAKTSLQNDPTYAGDKTFMPFELVSGVLCTIDTDPARGLFTCTYGNHPSQFSCTPCLVTPSPAASFCSSSGSSPAIGVQDVALNVHRATAQFNHSPELCDDAQSEVRGEQPPPRYTPADVDLSCRPCFQSPVLCKPAQSSSPSSFPGKETPALDLTINQSGRQCVPPSPAGANDTHADRRQLLKYLLASAALSPPAGSSHSSATSAVISGEQVGYPSVAHSNLPTNPNVAWNAAASGRLPTIAGYLNGPAVSVQPCNLPPVWVRPSIPSGPKSIATPGTCLQLYQTDQSPRCSRANQYPPVNDSLTQQQLPTSTQVKLVDTAPICILGPNASAAPPSPLMLPEHPVWRQSPPSSTTYNQHLNDSQLRQQCVSRLASLLMSYQIGFERLSHSKLVSFVNWAEAVLYRTSPSYEAYADWSTLENRVRVLMTWLAARNTSQRHRASNVCTPGHGKAGAAC